MYCFQDNRSQWCILCLCIQEFSDLFDYLFPAFPVVNKNNINIFSRRRFSHKSLSSLSPQVNDVTGENTFVTSALSDIVTDRLAEINTTFKLLVQ